jgi:hypothetical protein
VGCQGGDSVGAWGGFVDLRRKLQDKMLGLMN